MQENKPRIKRDGVDWCEHHEHTDYQDEEQPCGTIVQYAIRTCCKCDYSTWWKTSERVCRKHNWFHRVFHSSAEHE